MTTPAIAIIAEDVPARGCQRAGTVPIAPARVSTALMDALVRETGRRPRSLRRRALSGLRKARLLVGDPTVVSDIDGRALAMPLSHDLPLHRAAHPDYSRNLGRAVAALQAARPGAGVVDIGANVGDSVAIIRDAAPDTPILCIEGDSHFLPFLEHNVRDLVDVEIAPVYVGHSAGDQGRGMSVVRAAGTASLVERDDDSPNIGVSTQSLEAILAEHPGFARPGMLKLDTDGHDADIVLQAEAVIRSARPVVFLEFDPPMAARVGGVDPVAALEFLHRLGYRRALVFANTGALVAVLDGDTWLSEVARLATRLGPARPVAYFDICVFAEVDLGVADELERLEGASSR